MDESTTNPDAQYDEALEAQPVEALDAAANTDSESIETTDQTESEESAEATTSDDEDNSDYWAKKGIDINTAEGQAKAAKIYRDAEKALTQKAQQASELTKQINGQPLAVDTDNDLVRQALEKSSQLETTLTVNQWKAEKNITPEQDVALGQYLVSNPDKAWLLKNGHLNLDDIHAMSGVGKVDTSQVKKQGGQEALQNLANKQRVSAVSGNAVNSTPPTGLTAANAEAWWDSLGSEGRADPANRAKMDSLL